MKGLHRLVSLVVPPLGVFVLFAGTALAQFGGQPGGMGPGMGGPQPMGEEPKEEGPAEAAPEDDAERPTDLDPLGGYPNQQRQATQIIEIDGYFRTRTDFLHKLHLGQGYLGSPGAMGTSGVQAGRPVVDPTQPGFRRPPFPMPLSCGYRIGKCGDKNLSGGNLRLRIEPTVNVTDQVRVIAQVDVLDNVFLGSTPDSLVRLMDPALRTSRAPVPSLSNSQVPPELNRNSVGSSIRAKRAWGEVDSELGSLRFGRMPWHFGRGMFFNNGNCPDCEGGTTVDRVMAIARLYGHQVAASWDFGPQGYILNHTELGVSDPYLTPYDLSQRDDVFQMTASISLMDDDRRFRERIGLGELVINYGAQVVYRKQGQEVYEIQDPMNNMERTQWDGTREQLAANLTLDVDALMFIPSLWFKLGWKALTIEAEATGIVGKIGNARLLTADMTNRRLNVQQIGWVLASELRLYRDTFFLGFETGGATGDQAEDPSAYLNHRWKLPLQPRGDDTLSDFKFSPDYHVDEILFRRILGTVSNAIYVKPAMTYWVDMAETRQLGITAALIYSLAPVTVSTPGNALSYGVEMNVGLNYRNPGDGFYAGATWGVLWPMAGLNRGVLAPTETSARVFQRTEDASSAQVLRTFLGIRF